jgi:ribosomal-protein-alanine N-acetyltransferase
MLEVNFDPFPVLETPRLILREITPGDAPALFKLRSDAGVMEFLSRPRMTSVGEAHSLIQKMLDSRLSNTGIAWAITLKGNSAMIGTVGFWRIDKENYRAEIGYILDRDHWRKGIMSEAFSVMFPYGFRQMNLHSVEANVHVGNKPSALLLGKHGFVQEAHFKENFYFDGRFEDSLIFCLLERNLVL